jgi:hypothetical protein
MPVSAGGGTCKIYCSILLPSSSAEVPTAIYLPRFAGNEATLWLALSRIASVFPESV